MKPRHIDIKRRRSDTTVSKIPRVLALLLVCLAFSDLMARAQSGGAVTNQDVVKMLAAGLTETTVLNAIRQAAKRDFDIGPMALIDLKKKGVSDSIIEEMQKATAAGPSELSKPIALTKLGQQDAEGTVKSFASSHPVQFRGGGNGCSLSPQAILNIDTVSQFSETEASTVVALRCAGVSAKRLKFGFQRDVNGNWFLTKLSQIPGESDYQVDSDLLVALNANLRWPVSSGATPSNPPRVPSTASSASGALGAEPTRSRDYAAAAGKYIRKDNGDYTELRGDGTFIVQQNGKLYSGTYTIEGDTVTAQVSNGPNQTKPAATRFRLSAAALVDLRYGTVWEK